MRSSGTVCAACTATCSAKCLRAASPNCADVGLTNLSHSRARLHMSTPPPLAFSLGPFARKPVSLCTHAHGSCDDRFNEIDLSGIGLVRANKIDPMRDTMAKVCGEQARCRTHRAWQSHMRCVSCRQVRAYFRLPVCRRALSCDEAVGRTKGSEEVAREIFGRDGLYASTCCTASCS